MSSYNAFAAARRLRGVADELERCAGTKDSTKDEARTIRNLASGIRMAAAIILRPDPAERTRTRRKRR